MVDLLRLGFNSVVVSRHCGDLLGCDVMVIGLLAFIVWFGAFGLWFWLCLLVCAAPSCVCRFVRWFAVWCGFPSCGLGWCLLFVVGMIWCSGG